MSDLQSKLGGGINRIQDSLQQGKQKLQTAQEVSQLNKLLQGKLDERGLAIFKLGEEVYKKIRKQEFQDQELAAITEQLERYDHEIYSIQAKLSELSNNNGDGQVCPSCQVTINHTDKFCGGCGAPVNNKTTDKETDTVPCQKCEVSVPTTASYCGCCGSKMQ
ncbi:double zinc ribbon domain-containing protein [Bacillus sp. JJ722]|uniref:double zinc ribbon domain-containing protein n=1 Tax=Bacillus sp. JJ722 TaxID=3122973 RepID=UPI003000738B